jgi:mono/diheme cytochrome c family protein
MPRSGVINNAIYCNLSGGRKMAFSKLGLVWRYAVAAAMVAGTTVMPDVVRGAEPGSYRVVDGKVNRNTFAGWRTYHSGCHICHGQGAIGTDIAPSLLTRMQSLTAREFAERVLVRYRLDAQMEGTSVEDRASAREEIIAEVAAKKRGRKGRISMPAWETDTEVNAHILDLYAYLSARADGMIGAQRPGLLEDE